ncbi:centromere protein L-like isoform X2 [Frankliniella occidentalis]|uniref:Centromere protein L n=1 Tax=Frankliniella occidentalis TaxID=133901 RepID=A0A6J1SF25_FRAOC|nr:centromere protein L-like isoform X2 [Frankliniella occidentalis]
MSFSLPSPPRRMRRREQSHNTIGLTAPKAVSTPYNTPFKSRNQSLRCPNVIDKNTKKAVSQLKDLLNKQWYIFNVSPLFNMDYTEVSLKRYARRLKTKLTSRLSDSSAVEYEVSYAPYKNLQLNEIDHGAIEVLVEKMTESGNRSIAYYAILLSWGASSEMQPENAVYLPILICRGLKSIIKQVHTEFQLVHDCFVNSIHMNAEEMRILSIDIFDSSSYQEDEIKLRYHLPQNMKSGELDISLPTFVLSNLWKSIHKHKEWTDEEVTTFWVEIHNHTYRAFGIELGHCILAKVTLPDISFTQEAVYVKKKEHMYLFLSHLMSLCNHLTTVVPFVHEVSLPSSSS